MARHAPVDGRSDAVGPSAEAEAILGEIRTLLADLGRAELPTVGLDTDLGDLGLDSLAVVEFFDRLRDEYPGDSRLDEFLGVTYDTCHLAIEFEDPAEALALLQSHRVKISKIHLSNALKLRIAESGRAVPALIQRSR